jgi:hypothetical protein
MRGKFAVRSAQCIRTLAHDASHIASARYVEFQLQGTPGAVPVDGLAESADERVPHGIRISCFGPYVCILCASYDLRRRRAISRRAPQQYGQEDLHAGEACERTGFVVECRPQEGINA